MTTEEDAIDMRDHTKVMEVFELSSFEELATFLSEY